MASRPETFPVPGVCLAGKHHLLAPVRHRLNGLLLAGLIVCRRRRWLRKTGVSSKMLTK